MKLPNRNDKVYKEIERFKEYELTNCIVYEMAIRNEYVKELMFLYQKELNSWGIDISFNLNEECINIPSKRIVENYEYSKYYKEETIESNFIKDELELHSIYPTALQEFFLVPGKNDIKDIDPMVIIEEHQENFIDETKPRKRTLILDKYNSNYHEDNSYKLQSLSNVLNINYSRPKIISENEKKADVSLNLKLSKEELIAYIEKIKDTFDKDNSIIMTPLELLGKELNIEYIDIKNMTAKEWADMFYMYDFFNASKDLITDKHNDLIENLTVYNGYKIEKSKAEQKKGESKSKIISYEAYSNLILRNPGIYNDRIVKNFYSLSTIKSRLKLMKSLIEDMNYKKLI